MKQTNESGSMGTEKITRVPNSF